MPNDTLVLGLIAGSLLASFGYLYKTAQRATPEEQEQLLVQQGNPDVWLKGMNVQYISKDTTLLNALDALAVYRYIDNIQFAKIINEIEQFYTMFAYVMATGIGKENPAIIAHGSQYILNIRYHMHRLKSLVLENYPNHQRDLLDRRLDNRIQQVESVCNSYYLNFIKEAKCAKASKITKVR